MESLEPRTLLAFTGLPRQIGDTGFDMGKRIVATPDGGYVEAGLFQGRVTFASPRGPVRLTSRGDTDIFVAKYSAAGSLQWVKQFGGIEYSDEIAKQDTIDFAADPERAGGFFINGVSADPLLAAEYVTDLAVASDGSVFLSGEFVGAVDFDPGHGRTVFTTFDESYYDGFVLKLNTGGGLRWARQIGGRFTDTVNAMSFDDSGNIFLTGLFSRTVSFVPGNPRFTLIAQGRADGYVMKMNAAGSIQWIDQFGSDGTKPSERDAGLDVAVDSAGNVYAVGTYAGDSTFTTTSGNSSIVPGVKRTDAFIAKYSNDGALVRVVGYGAKGYDGLNNIAIDSHDNLVVSGYYQGNEFDADPGPGVSRLPEPLDRDGKSTDLTDSFIEQFDSNLSMQWVQQFHGTGVELMDQIKIDASDNIVIGGSFYGTARFGNAGPLVRATNGVENFDDRNDSDREESYDAYVWKLDSAGDTTWVKYIGAASDDFGAGVDVASDGSILFTGRFRGTVDFDTTRAQRRLRGLGLADAFVTGFDSNGHPLF